MVRRFQPWGLSLLMLAVVFISPACFIDYSDDFTVHGSGTPTTRSFDLRDFTAIQVSADFDLEIVQSPTFAVSLTVDDNLVDGPVVRVQGDTLVFDLNWLSFDPTTLKARISMPSIQRLQLGWGGHARLGVFEPSASFQVETSFGSTVTGSVVTGRFDAKLSGGQLELSGSAKDATLVANGSRLKLDSFEISTGRISLSGGSTGDVYVTGRLASAAASGASFLSYRGNPELGSITTLDTSRIVRSD